MFLEPRPGSPSPGRVFAPSCHHRRNAGQMAVRCRPIRSPGSSSENARRVSAISRARDACSHGVRRPWPGGPVRRGDAPQPGTPVRPVDVFHPPLPVLPADRAARLVLRIFRHIAIATRAANALNRGYLARRAPLACRPSGIFARSRRGPSGWAERGPCRAGGSSGTRPPTAHGATCTSVRRRPSSLRGRPSPGLASSPVNRRTSRSEYGPAPPTSRA